MSEMMQTNEFSLEAAITAAVQIPGVKVDRNKFLAETFSDKAERLQEILDKGPVGAGLTKEELYKIAKHLIFVRTSESSLVSFAAGIPGGLAMAAMVPADLLQFFGMNLRIAQELSYLYGSDDLWKNGQIDDEKVRNELILYCGVMFGVSGAASGVRVLSTQLAKTTLKKLPQKALMKTVWYPLLKKIAKAVGVTVTKKTLAQGVSKAIPVVGGVISGGLNFASMMPMAERLQKTLEDSCFSYSTDDYEKDCIIIESISDEEEVTQPSANNFNVIKDSVAQKAGASVSALGSTLTGAFGKAKRSFVSFNNQKAQKPQEDVYSTIKKLMELKEMGAITEEEFVQKKTELLRKL